MARSSKVTDYKDRILRYVVRNGAKDQKAIFEGLKREAPPPPTAATFKRSIYALKKDQSLKQGLYVNPNWLANQKRYWVFVKTQFLGTESESNYQGELLDKIKDRIIKADYANDLLLVDAAIMLGGEFDIMLCIVTDNERQLNKFVTHFLRTRTGIRETMTSRTVLD